MLHRIIFSTAALAIATTTASAQSLSGYRYSVRMHSESKDEQLSTVRDAGDRARFDFRSEDGYLLILENGRRIIHVHTRDREYNEVADTALDRVIGRALHAVSRTGLVEFNVRHSDVRTRLIGPGGKVAGRTTQHYRLTQDFTVSLRTLGHKGDDMHQVVVTDYWVDPTLRLARNPFLDLLSSGMTALAQQSPEFRQRTADARAAMFQGVPLRVVVTAMEAGKEKHDQSLVLEVTGLEKTTFDRDTFEIPAGYQREKGMFNFSFGNDN